MTRGRSATVDSYIAGFPPDIAFILARLREAILKAAPGAPALSPDRATGESPRQGTEG
jgi:hypothetical protein